MNVKRVGQGTKGGGVESLSYDCEPDWDHAVGKGTSTGTTALDRLLRPRGEESNIGANPRTRKLKKSGGANTRKDEFTPINIPRTPKGPAGGQADRNSRATRWVRRSTEDVERNECGMPWGLTPGGLTSKSGHLSHPRYP